MKWLVTVVRGGPYDFGPAVLIEADTAEQAAELGVPHLANEDGGYGVTCDHCEGIAITGVTVLPFADAIEFERTTTWSRP